MTMSRAILVLVVIHPAFWSVEISCYWKRRRGGCKTRWGTTGALNRGMPHCSWAFVGNFVWRRRSPLCKGVELIPSSIFAITGARSFMTCRKTFSIKPNAWSQPCLNVKQIFGELMDVVDVFSPMSCCLLVQAKDTISPERYSWRVAK